METETERIVIKYTTGARKWVCIDGKPIPVVVAGSVSRCLRPPISYVVKLEEEIPEDALFDTEEACFDAFVERVRAAQAARRRR